MLEQGVQRLIVDLQNLEIDLKNRKEETAKRIKELLIASINALDPMPTFKLRRFIEGSKGPGYLDEKVVDEEGVFVCHGEYKNPILTGGPGIVLTKEGLFVYHPNGRDWAPLGSSNVTISGSHFDERQPATPEEYLEYAVTAVNALNRVKQERVVA